MEICFTNDELVNRLEALKHENLILQNKLKQNLKKSKQLAGDDLSESEIAETQNHADLINALQSTETRYQKIIDFAPFPFIILKDFVIEFVNQSAVGLFGGSSPAEITGKPFSQFIHQNQETVIENIPFILNDNRNAARELKILCLDGVIRNVELNAVRHQEKNSSSVYVYLKDITLQKKTEKYITAIGEIQNIIHNSLYRNEIVEKAMHQAAIATECDSAAVSFYSEKKWIVKYIHGFDESVLGLTFNEEEEPHALLALKTKSPVIIEDALTDPRVINERMKLWGITSVLVVPLFTSHKNIGVIFFNYYHSKNFSAEKIDFVKSLSSSLSLALENSALYENVLNELTARKKKELELDRANQSLKALSRSSQAMVYANDEMTYAKEVCRIVVEDFGFSMVSINYMEANEEKTVRPFAWSGLDEEYIKNLKLSWENNEIGQGPTGRAIRSKKPAVCNNIYSDVSFSPWRDEGIKHGFRSCISLPLITDNKPFGTLNIYSAEPDSFSKREIKFLSELTKDVSYAVSTIRLREAGRQTLKALTDSEERFRMLTEKSNALICELDLNGKILYANSKFAELLGYESTELQEYHISENCQPELQQNFLNSIIHFFPNPAFKNEWYLKDKNGLWHWFRCHTSAFTNARGEERRSVILFEISDIKQAEEQLKKYTRDLKALNATKDKFFGIIAHDLKNPFTSLLGASELLINSLENFDQETVRHIGALLYDSAKRGYALLQNLLEWSRSQSGTITFNPQQLQLRQVALENVSNIRISAYNKNQHIVCDIPDDIEVKADQNMLNTIIRNLLHNAVKFSHDGGKIVLKAEKCAENVTVSVRDSGIGIAGENLKKLFKIDEKFTNLGTRNEMGTGLGLILCREFVEKHNGKIWAESKEGKGSKFYFTIPTL